MSELEFILNSSIEASSKIVVTTKWDIEQLIEKNMFEQVFNSTSLSTTYWHVWNIKF